MPGGAGLFSRVLRFYLRGDASSLLQSFRRSDTAATKTKLAFDRLRRGVQATERRFNRFRRNIVSLRSAFALLAGAAGIGFAIRGIVQFADAMTLARSRLRVVVSENEQLIKVQRRLFEVAQTTRSAYESLLNSYARVARSTKALNVTDEDRLTFIETVTKAIRVSGSTAIEASAGLIQFSQALASNRLSGDELRSVFEQLPRLALLIGKSLGVGIGRLREFGEQGKLTADVIFNAVLDGAGQINKEFALVERTVGQAFTQLRNQLLALISELDQTTGFSRNLSAALDEIRSIIGSDSFRSIATATLRNLGSGIRSVAENLDVVRNILIAIVSAKAISSFIRLATLLRDLRGVTLLNIFKGVQAFRLFGFAGGIAAIAASIGTYILLARRASGETELLESQISNLPDTKLIEVRLERSEEANQKIVELSQRLEQIGESSSELTLAIESLFNRLGSRISSSFQVFINDSISNYQNLFQVIISGAKQAGNALDEVGNALERMFRSRRGGFTPQRPVEAQRVLNDIVEANKTALRELEETFDPETAERIRLLTIETLFPLFPEGAQSRVERFRGSLNSFSKQYDDAVKEFENQRRAANVRIARLGESQAAGAFAKSTNVFNKRITDSLEEENERITETIRLARRQISLISGNLVPDASIEALDQAENKLVQLIVKKQELGKVLQEAYSFRDILGGLGVRETQLTRNRAFDRFIEDQTRSLELRLERLNIAAESLRSGVNPDLFEFQARNVFGGRQNQVDEQLQTATGQNRTELIAYREELERLTATHIQASRATKDFQEAQSLFFSRRQLESSIIGEQSRLDILSKERDILQDARGLSSARLQIEQEHRERTLKFSASIQISNDAEEESLDSLISLSQRLRDLALERVETSSRNREIKERDNLLQQINFETLSREFDLETRRIELRNKLHGLSTRESIISQIRASREQAINDLLEKRNALVEAGSISTKDLNQINSRIEALQKEIDLINQKRIEQREAAEERSKEIQKETEIERRRQRVIEESARTIARGFERAVTRSNSLSGALKEILGSLLRIVIQYTIIDRLQGVLERILRGTIGRLPGGSRPSGTPGQSPDRSGPIGQQDVEAVARQEIKTALNVEFQREVFIQARNVIVQGSASSLNKQTSLGRISERVAANEISKGIETLTAIILGGSGSPTPLQGGGRAERRRAFFVGERGKELFVPDIDGTVVPNSRIRAGGGGGVSVEINNFIESSDREGVERALIEARPRQLEDAETIARAVASELISKQ